MSESERERLARLREKQLRDRDPGPGVKVKWKGPEAVKKEPFFKDFFGVLPRKVQGAIVGGLFGLIVSIASSALIPEPFGWVCGGVFFLIAIGVGVIVGGAADQGGYMK